MTTFQISKYTMKKSYKRKKGPVNSKKITVDGITFASGLERYMYKVLKDAGRTNFYFVSGFISRAT